MGLLALPTFSFSIRGPSGEYLLQFSSGKALLRAPEAINVKTRLSGVLALSPDNVQLQNITTFTAHISDPRKCSESLEKPGTFRSWQGGVYDPNKVYQRCDGSIMETPILFLDTGGSAPPTGKIVVPFVYEAYLGVPLSEKKTLAPVSLSYTAEPASLQLMHFSEFRVTSSDNGTHLIGFTELGNDTPLGALRLEVHNELWVDNDIFCANIQIHSKHVFPLASPRGDNSGNVTIQATNYYGQPVEGVRVHVICSKSTTLESSPSVTDSEGFAIIYLEPGFVSSPESLFVKFASWNPNNTYPCSSEWMSLSLAPTVGSVYSVNLANHEGTLSSPISLSGHEGELPKVELRMMDPEGNPINDGDFDISFELLSYTELYLEYPSYSGIMQRCIPFPYSLEGCTTIVSDAFFDNVTSYWNQRGNLAVSGRVAPDTPGWLLFSISVNGIRMNRTIVSFYFRQVNEVRITGNRLNYSSPRMIGFDVVSNMAVRIVGESGPLQGVRSRVYISSDNTTSIGNGNWAICSMNSEVPDRTPKTCSGSMVNLVFSDPSDDEGIARFPDVLIAAGDPCAAQGSACSGMGKMTLRFSVLTGNSTIISHEFLEMDVLNPVRAIHVLQPPSKVITPSFPFVQQPILQIILFADSTINDAAFVITVDPAKSPVGAGAVLSLLWRIDIQNPVLHVPRRLTQHILEPYVPSCCYGSLANSSGTAFIKDMTAVFQSVGSASLTPVQIDGDYSLRFCSLGVCSSNAELRMQSTAEHLTILSEDPSDGYVELPLGEIRVKATLADGVPAIRQRIYVKIHKQIGVDGEEIKREDYRRGQIAPSIIAQDTEKDGIAIFNPILISGGRGNYSFAFFTVSGASSKPSTPFKVETLIEETNVLNEKVASEVFLNSPMEDPIRVGGTLRGGTQKANPAFASAVATAMLDDDESGFAVLAGNTAIVGKDGVASFDNLRFIAGSSGAYTLRFVIQGVRSRVVPVTLVNPVEINQRGLENWWQFVVGGLIFSLPLLVGNNTRNPKCAMTCASFWSMFIFLVLALAGFTFLAEQARYLSYPDPFFGTVITSAVVCALFAMYLYIRVVVMEYLVTKADAVSSGKKPRRGCCCCCFPIVLKCLSVVLCIRRSYTEAESGLTFPKRTMREKGTAILLNENGVPLVPLRCYLGVAHNITYYRRRLLYSKYLVHRLLSLGRKRFTENYHTLRKFREELLDAANVPPELREPDGRYNDFYLMNRVSNARRHYVMSVLLHQTQWERADPARAEYILQPESYSLSEISGRTLSQHAQAVEMEFLKKARRIDKKRSAIERNLHQLYDRKSAGTCDILKGFFLEKYYKFMLAKTAPARKHELYETKTDFFFPQRLLVSLGMSIVLTMLVILTGIAVSRHIAFELDQGKAALHAASAEASGLAASSVDMKIIQQAANVAMDNAAVREQLSRLEEEGKTAIARRLPAASTFIQTIQSSGLTIDQGVEIIKLGVYVGVGFGAFFAVLTNAGIWSSFFYRYRQTVLRGRDGFSTINKYQSLAKSTQFIAQQVWHAAFATSGITVLTSLVVAVLTILLHPKLGLLRNEPWVQYLTGFVGATTAMNTILSLILVRFIINGNVIRHRRLFSVFDVVHSMTALVTGLSMVLARFTIHFVFGLGEFLRIDDTKLPAKFAALDGAYNSFRSMLLIDYLHNNPIVMVLCSSLWEDIKAQRKKRLEDSTPRTNPMAEKPLESEGPLRISKRAYKNSNMQRLRAKCWLAVTLYHNPQLIYMRRHQLKRHEEHPFSVWE
eukprot:gb/GECG01007173.1/.p1 GENE.gb/GECG01007173.1/~~gb/GECG01007173.1/.p1  ORF type:complete len:1764 (+),score=149.79 gb/GECG01007173.1/:1-5292(+)